MNKKIISTLVLLSLVLNTISFASVLDETETTEEKTYSDTLKTVYTQSREISDGLTYTRNILSHEKDGAHREFILEYKPNLYTDFHFAENKYLYSTNTVSNIAKNSYPDEYFVAGVNGDFFNMSTGVPESAYIKNYELYTTDRDSFCFAENEDGSYFIDKPQISLSLTDTHEKIYKILHLNKEFSEYGLYMYNSRYSDKTRIASETTDIFLSPFDAKYSLEEVVENSENEEIITLYDEYINALHDEQKKTEEAENLQESEESEESELPEMIEESKETENTENSEDLEDSEYTEVAEETENADEDGENSDEVENQEDVEVQEKLSDTYKESLIRLIEEEMSLNYIGENFYQIADMLPRIGGSENLVVTNINYSAKNSVIPENTYVISAVKNIYEYELGDLNVGDEFVFFIDGNENFYNVVNAIGTDTVIVNNGEIVGSNRLDHYSSKQPRTAIGIKNDGSIILYTCDGRQGSYSKGLTLSELAEQMKKLGCEYAANLDGGGSTVLSASLYGFDSAKTQNKPSAGSERRVSNAFVFTNTREKSGEVYGAYNYDEMYLTLDDNKIELGEIVYSDENGFSSDFEVTDDEKYPQNLSLYTKGNSYIEDFVFYPNGDVGNIEIYASFDDGETENMLTNVISLSEPDKIIISADKYEIAPFEDIKLDVKSEYLSFDVSCDFDSFIWTASRILNKSELNNTIDTENTEITEIEEDIKVEDTENIDETEPEENKETVEETEPEILGTFENGVFAPIVEGAEIEIKAERGSVSESIKIKVDMYPFVDIKEHWSVKNVYSLAKKGIVKGELDENGNAYYFPERKYTRNEFCVMLLRVTGIGTDIEVPDRTVKEDNLTVDTQDVADETVEIIDETPDENASSDEQILQANTEELTDENINELPDENTEDVLDENPTEQEVSALPYTDSDLIPDWAYEAVYKLTEAELINNIIHTDEYGNMLFDGNAEITREEVMLVLGKLCVPDSENDNENIKVTEIDSISDLTAEQKENEFIINTIKCGVFSGYEDNTIRPENTLSRAEAATVFDRLINVLN